MTDRISTAVGSSAERGRGRRSQSEQAKQAEKQANELAGKPAMYRVLLGEDGLEGLVGSTILQP